MLTQKDIGLLIFLAENVISYEGASPIDATLRVYTVNQMEHALGIKDQEAKEYLEDAAKRGVITGKYSFSHNALFEYHARFSAAPEFENDDLAKLVKYFDRIKVIPMEGSSSLDSTKKIYSESSLRGVFMENEFDEAMAFFKKYELIVDGTVQGFTGKQYSFTHSSLAAYHNAKAAIIRD